ncbi:hypothetical protein [Mesorhizobium caraganae]|uniref:hypothetical protein n=1 Tax=Mesorhizobium caraganae TaxID=483206 RepID=UPI0017817F71|nr:hypothetical protein [Mesorhizobium caraganae]
MSHVVVHFAAVAATSFRSAVNYPQALILRPTAKTAGFAVFWRCFPAIRQNRQFVTIRYSRAASAR